MSTKATSSTLRNTTHSFCTSLLSPPSPSTLLSTHFTSTPTIHEHGPSWATSRLPFLGRPFTGTSSCESYFALLSHTLRMQLTASSFPGPEEFIVDAEAGMVSVVGSGVFESVETGKKWEETFIYRFGGFDGEGRIGRWEIWADPLSAWVAVGGGEEGNEGQGKGGVYDDGGARTLAQEYVQELGPEGVKMP